MIVTLDGPAGSGKSTLAKRLAGHFGWLYLDTGAMYRALALASIAQGVAPDDAVGLESLAQSIRLECNQDRAGFHVCLDGQDVTQAIRAPDVTSRVSEVSSHPGVREIIVAMQRAYDPARHPGCDGLIVEGRDMGTVVFPAAPIKFFLIATIAERAQRRQAQLASQGVDSTLSEVEAAIAERDHRDSSRAVAPLVAASDALVVDTTGLSIDAVFTMMVKRIEAEASAESVPRLLDDQQRSDLDHDRKPSR